MSLLDRIADWAVPAAALSGWGEEVRVVPDDRRERRVVLVGGPIDGAVCVEADPCWPVVVHLDGGCYVLDGGCYRWEADCGRAGC